MVNGLQNQMEKMRIARENNPRPDVFRLGRDEVILNYLANQNEQENFPFYWIDNYNKIHCHCNTNPFAQWFEEDGWFKCSKLTKAAGKCTLFIPIPELKNNL